MKKYKSKIISFALFVILGAAAFVLQRNFDHSTIEIPVIFNKTTNVPLFHAKIENKDLILALDLGSKFQLSLEKEVLNNIKNKTVKENVNWHDIKGNYYTTPSYKIPTISIGRKKIKNMVAREEHDDHKKNRIIWTNEPNSGTNVSSYSGKIGRPLLYNTNIILDFANSKIVLCNNNNNLKQSGIFLERMIKVPFEKNTKGIILKVETDLGYLRFGLDTGCTLSILRKSLINSDAIKKGTLGLEFFTTHKFVIGNKDFKTKNICVVSIAPELDILDGMLGMDFLKNRTTYIDYKNGHIYFSKYEKNN